MVNIVYAGKTIAIKTGQDVLSALLENGQDIPHSCRAGACQSCLMRASHGEVPAEAQQGLKPTLVEQGFFLACRCQPKGDMEIALAADTAPIPATVTSKDLLSHDVIRLRLMPESRLEYRSGQYTRVWGNGVGRSYSLASVPEYEDFLEFHIRRIDGGELSPWLFDHVQSGDRLELQSAIGNCFYVTEDQYKPIILIGTGTGLAPLYGIVRDALRQGHKGEIHLLHGSIQASGLYLHRELEQLDKDHDNFHYHACVLENKDSKKDITVANVETLAFGIVNQPADWQIYLCGDPQLVSNLKKRFFLAGAAINSIYTDPFVIGPKP